MENTIKPKCSCGLEMDVVEFIGRYKQFKYFKLHKNCKCGDSKDANDYKEDRIEVDNC